MKVTGRSFFFSRNGESHNPGAGGGGPEDA